MVGQDGVQRHSVDLFYSVAPWCLHRNTSFAEKVLLKKQIWNHFNSVCSDHTDKKRRLGWRITVGLFLLVGSILFFGIFQTKLEPSTATAETVGKVPMNMEAVSIYSWTVSCFLSYSKTVPEHPIYTCCFLLIINSCCDILFRQLHSFDKQSQAIRSLAWAPGTQNQVFSMGKRAKQSGGTPWKPRQLVSENFGKSWDICVPNYAVITQKTLFFALFSLWRAGRYPDVFAWVLFFVVDVWESWVTWIWRWWTCC